MDKFKIMRRIEELSEEERKELHYWLQDRVADDLNENFDKAMKRLKKS